MNHTARIFLCIPLLLGLGCAFSRIETVPEDPNTSKEKLDITIDNEISEVEPNTPDEPVTFILSGSLGVANVILKGLPGDPNTQANGTYQVTVDKGWAGTVTPEKEGFTFLPAARTYAAFTQDIFHEIYVPQKITANLSAVKQTTDEFDSLTLTGLLKLNGDPVPGITVRTISAPASAVTDANGCFVLQVPSGWKGTLRLEAPESAETTLGEPKDKSVPLCGMSACVPECASQPVASEVSVPGSPAEEEPLITLGVSSLSLQATEELHHDLKVMCRLLSEQALGLSLVKRDPQNEPRAIYIPGDGVLFDIGIDWPLVGQLPEPDVSAQSGQWQRASDYIARQYEPLDVLERLHHIKTQAYIQKMTDSLVHASHIRHLAGESSITLHIWGPPPSRDCLIRTDKKAIDDYAAAVSTNETFEEQVTLKLH